MAIEWTKEHLPFQEGLIEVNMVVEYRDRTTQNITDCPAYFLQGMRNGVLKRLPAAMDRYSKRYHNAIPVIIKDFLAAFEDRCVQHAALIVPPSSRNDARPYANALLDSGIASVDLSYCVKRIDSSFRAGKTRSFEEVCSSIEVVQEPQSDSFGSLIVVDDVLSSGRSVAAVVLALLNSGFILNSTEIFVAAVLSVERKVQDEPAGEEETA
jgi:hypothetical protein